MIAEVGTHCFSSPAKQNNTHPHGEQRGNGRIRVGRTPPALRARACGYNHQFRLRAVVPVLFALFLPVTALSISPDWLSESAFIAHADINTLRTPTLRSVEPTWPASVGTRNALRFFQQFISPVDGSRCPMSPTCSVFGYRSIQKYGLWLGTLKTIDRLNRCTHDLDFYPVCTRESGEAYEDLP